MSETIDPKTGKKRKETGDDILDRLLRPVVFGATPTNKASPGPFSIESDEILDRLIGREGQIKPIPEDLQFDASGFPAPGQLTRGVFTGSSRPVSPDPTATQSVSQTAQAIGGQPTREAALSAEPGVIQARGAEEEITPSLGVRATRATTETVAGAGFVAAATLAGGAVGLYRLGQAGIVVGNIVGSGVGEAFRQFASGEEFSPQGIFTAMGFAGLGSATAVGGTRVGGRIAGQPKVIQENVARRSIGAPGGAIASKPGVSLGRGRDVKGFGLTFRSPRPRSFDDVMQGISDEGALRDTFHRILPRLRNKLSPDRIEKQRILQQMTQDGAKHDTSAMKEALSDARVSNLAKKPTVPRGGGRGDFETRAEPGPVFSESRALNKKIDQIIERMPDEMTPLQLDEFMRKELTPKAFTGTGNVSHAKLASTIRRMREIARNQLLDSTPENLRSINARILQRMDFLEDAETMFGRGSSNAIANLRTAYNDGNEEIAATIFWVQETSGEKVAEDAMGLATQRAFVRSPTETAATASVTGFRKVLGGLASKPLAPLQNVAGPAAVFTEQLGRRGKAEEEAGHQRRLDEIRKNRGIAP